VDWARRSWLRPRPSPAAVRVGVAVVLAALSATVALGTGTALSAGLAGATSPVSVGAVNEVSAPCSGANAEVEQAVDPTSPGYVYEAWRGCAGIGFSSSSNAGATFSAAVTLPASTAAQGDPVVAVAPGGAVYVAFMVTGGSESYPVVDASFDHGQSFPQSTALTAPRQNNWGDSPNIAVGPDGTVYVTWDYGPKASSVVEHCTSGGSCSFLKGDLNVVVQKSTDDGKTFGPMVDISPGFPWSGADNAPIVVDGSGRLDVAYQDYPTNPTTHTLGRGINYFVSSSDGGATWSSPVAIGGLAGTMSLVEWWNEPSIGIDAAGNLYAAWDTQPKGPHQTADTGWLSYSQNGGSSWSTPVQAPSDTRQVPHIMEVVGTAAGKADVAWLSDSNPLGYAVYLRPFSVAQGWLSAPVQISTTYGAKTIWPGDTFGLSDLDPGHLVTSWGSGISSSAGSVVYAAQVDVNV
jgi:hypothetical protein